MMLKSPTMFSYWNATRLSKCSELGIRFLDCDRIGYGFRSWRWAQVVGDQLGSELLAS